MKINLGFKLTGAFLVVAVIAAGVGAVGLWNQVRLETSMEGIYRNNVRGLDRAADLAAAAAEHYRHLVEHSLTDDDLRMDQLEQSKVAEEVEFDERHAVYRENLTTDLEHDLIRELRTAWDQYLDVAATVIEQSRAGSMDATLAGYLVDEVTPLFDEVDTITAGLVDLNREQAAAANAEALALANGARSFMIALVIIAALIAVGLGLWISRSTVKPLRSVAQRANQIAKGAIYQDDIVLNRDDEIGDLAAAFNRMLAGLGKKTADLERIAKGDLDFTVDVESEDDVFGQALASMRRQLNEVLLQVTESVEQVSAGAGEVSDAGQNLSQGATEQASSLEEITSSMVQLSSQSRQNATNAGEANTLSKSARQSARDGDSHMQKLVEHMRNIDSSSEEIKKIITVIDDIAFQINLLALNANVEAARAGQHGRGFAVVAEEVRNLAVRAAESVKETSEKVQQSIETIKAGSEIAGTTADQFQTIVEGVTKVADLMEEISAASQEQSSGLEQINAAVEQIDQVTQTNTSSAEQTASAAEELSAQARALEDQTRRFTLQRHTTALPGTGDGADGQGALDMQTLTPEMLRFLQAQINRKLGSDNGTEPTAASGSTDDGTSRAGVTTAVAERSVGGQKGIALSLEDEEFDEF